MWDDSSKIFECFHGGSGSLWFDTVKHRNGATSFFPGPRSRFGCILRTTSSFRLKLSFAHLAWFATSSPPRRFPPSVLRPIRHWSIFIACCSQDPKYTLETAACLLWNVRMCFSSMISTHYPKTNPLFVYGPTALLLLWCFYLVSEWCSCFKYL